MNDSNQFAWLSASGLAALSVLHLRGPGTQDFLLARGLAKNPGSKPRHLWLKTAAGEPLDEVMLAREFGGFTLTCHGGTAVRAAIETELLAAGASAVDAAELGLFGAKTRYQRELLRLLCAAQSDEGVRYVLWALEHGEAALSRALESPESLPDLLARSEATRFLFEPFRVHIWGPVNAGKSSLLNALCGETLAEVGAEPGLTRDVIEGRFEFEGFTIRLFDTPGELESGSELELRAFAQARAQFENSGDIVLHLVPPGVAAPANIESIYVFSRADEAAPKKLPASGFPCATSVQDAASLQRLKRELVNLQRPGVSPENGDAFALDANLRADLQALLLRQIDAATLRMKWL